MKQYVKELIYETNLSQLMIKLNDEYPEYRLVQIIQSNYNTPVAVYYAVIEKELTSDDLSPCCNLKDRVI